MSGMRTRGFSVRALCISACIVLAMPTFAGAQSSLKAPISSIEWLLGSWTCSGSDWHTGAWHDQMLIHYSPDPGGLTMHYHSTIEGGASSGRITWDPNSSHFLDKWSASSGFGPQQGGAVAAQDEVTADRMVFTGLVESGEGRARIRMTKVRSGDGYRENLEQFRSDGTWSSIRTLNCRREG